jgi:hypothetical protein
MNRKAVFRPSLFAASAACLVAGALAQTPPSGTLQNQSRVQSQEPIYGSELMTEQERNEYRGRMAAAKTEQEREQLRLEQHARMKERARQRGVTLPDDPRAQGRGQGQGQVPRQGQGYGMGPGPGGTAGAGAGAGKGR